MQGSDCLIAENVVGIMRSLRVALRGEVEPTALTDTVRARIRAIDPALPVTSVQTMSEIVSRSAAVPRFNALLVSLFAVLALLLAAIGIGGMLAMSVSRRLPELGVRMALGAQRRTLVAMVIRQGMVLAAAGLAVGLPSAWLAVTGAFQPVVRDQPTRSDHLCGRCWPCWASWRSSAVWCRPGA